MVHSAVLELKSDTSHDSVAVDFNASIVSVYIETDPVAGAAPGPPPGHLLLGGGWCGHPRLRRSEERQRGSGGLQGVWTIF